MLDRDFGKFMLQLSNVRPALLVVSELSVLRDFPLQPVLPPDSPLLLRQDVRSLPSEVPLTKRRPLPHL